MQVTELLTQVREQPESVDFAEVIACIDANYQYTPTNFGNGDVQNAAGTNEGSCKILAFAQLHGLDQPQTLALFGKFYREDVLQNPDGSDHGNIRNFIQHGWGGVKFEKQALAG